MDPMKNKPNPIPPSQPGGAQFLDSMIVLGYLPRGQKRIGQTFLGGEETVYVPVGWGECRG